MSRCVLAIFRTQAVRDNGTSAVAHVYWKAHFEAALVVQVMPQDAKKFDTDCVRCAKVIGSSPGSSFVVNGMCAARGEALTSLKYSSPPLTVLPFRCPVDLRLCSA